MCTAICDGALFGRTFDLERSYKEEVVLTPRGWKWQFRDMPAFQSQYAMLGVATLREGIPLYYDAMNEKGLAIAALNFPQSCVYHPSREGFCNLPSFALIPYLLAHCESAEEAVMKLKTINLTSDGFSAALPPSPLHFLLADQRIAYTVEPLAEGLAVTENPLGVLANEPTFAYQLIHLADYSALSSHPPKNTLSPETDLPLYSRGLGGFGLPGDFSSPSRFVRAVFLKNHTVRSEEIPSPCRFFQIMAHLAIPRGAVRLADGLTVSTRYTSCASLSEGIWYLTTEKDLTLRSYSFGEGVRGESLLRLGEV